MAKILHDLGIEWPFLLAQIIIFLTVYFVLKKFAFGPITAMLEQRRSRIIEGEEKLAQIEKDLADAQAKKDEILAGANTDAQRMINEATESAASAGDKKRQEAVNEAGQIIAKAKEASELEHAKMMAELKQEFGRLVIDTTEKVTGKTLDNSDHDRINKEAAAQVAL